jgi:hypothetical protein
MSHRTFEDGHGRQWEVWEVIPTAVERRAANADGIKPPVERRRRNEARVSMPVALRSGWLAFESKGERRRLAPMPKDWAGMTDLELVGLLDLAERKDKPRRLIE